MKCRMLGAFVFLGLAGSVAGGAELDPLFPFLISYDAPDNVTSMAQLLDAPAGKYGFVRVQDGRFVNDNGPVRFFGTNLTGPANFPSHEDADKLAARLARFGINCVRLHYFDDVYGNFVMPAGQGIFTRSDSTQRVFDPAQVDRFDYLVSALKSRGIYVNMNLHVARWWDERDGFENKAGRPRQDKGLDNFEPRMIALQKGYARQLLTHTNTYTGLSYADDPCVAMVEINNENGLFNQYHEGVIDRLPEPYAGELRRQWNEWLRRRYVSAGELDAAWPAIHVPLSGEQIPDGAFDAMREGSSWCFKSGSAVAAATVQDGVLQVAVSRDGDDPSPELFGSVAVKAGEPYTLSFRIRQVGGESSGFEVYLDAEQQTWLRRKVKVDSEWLPVRCSFVAAEDSGSLRFALNRFRTGVYEIDDLSFCHGADSAETGRAGFEAGTVPVVRSDIFVSPGLRQDFYRFLLDTERAYWTGVSRFLKDELGVKVPVAGTQLGGTHYGFSPAPVQAELDYIDTHSYWCHPSPVNPQWKIGNLSMVNSLANIQWVAGMRVYGKPYTISEYNHPFPNQYGAEAMPMVSAYAALQGWDGVFQYTYNHSVETEPKRTGYFFSMIARTDVLAHLPACAAMFLRGDVRAAEFSVIASTDYSSYFRRLADWDAIYAHISRLGFDGRLTLMHQIAVDFGGLDQGKPMPDLTVPDLGRVASDTGELCWDTEIPGRGFLAVKTRNTKLFTGFPQGRRIDLGDGASLAVGQTRLGWATVSLVSRNASGFGRPGKAASILLAATGLAVNEGAELESLPNDKIAFKDRRMWGNGTVWVEGVPATVTFPSDAARTACYALDASGNRKTKVPVTPSVSGGTDIRIGPEYQTVWYEVEFQP